MRATGVMCSTEPHERHPHVLILSESEYCAHWTERLAEGGESL